MEEREKNGENKKERRKKKEEKKRVSHKVILKSRVIQDKGGIA